MTGVTLSTANYDLILPAWNSQGAMSFSGTVNFGLSKYTGGGAVATAHSGLITKWGAITDGGIAPNNAFEFTWKTDNVGTSNDNQATLPITISADLDCVVTWGDADNSTTTLNASSSIGDLTHTYSGGAGTKNISILGTGINGFSFNNVADKLKILEVSNVGNLDITENSMFFGCTNLTWTATDVPTITTTNLSNTFKNCSNFNSNISNWDVSSVVNMSEMFSGASIYNQVLNSWNVGSVTDMADIFAGTSAFNQPLNSWNVGSVLNMNGMFSNATSFDQNISVWDINQVTNFTNFMIGATLSTTNYDLLLPAWDAQGAMSFSGTAHFGFSAYTAGGAVATAHASLTTKWGAITDGGAINGSFDFTWKTDNVGTSNDDQATLPITISAGLNLVVTWGDTDGSTTSLNSASSAGDLTHTYSGGAGTKSISISGSGINGFSFNNGGDKLKILQVSQVGDLDLTETSTFFGCTNLTWTATDAPTITTTNLENTFRDCTNFNGDISNWVVSNVTNINFILSSAAAFNQSLNGWDVSNVLTMDSAFNGNSIYNQPLNSWNVGSVTDMSDIFNGASLFNQDISSWNVSSVLNMNGMFNNTTNFNQNISSWDINQVTDFVNFMNGVTLSLTNYDLILPAWDGQGAMSFSGTVNFGASTYTAGGVVAAAHASLVTKWGGITDGGAISGGFDFTWKTDNSGASNSDQARLPFTISASLDCVVTWGDADGSTTTLNASSVTGDLTHTYSDGAGTKSISISGTGINGFRFAGSGDLLKILEVSNVGNLDITADATFLNCANLTWTATDAPTITTTNLTQTFRGCFNFNGNINNWDVSGVTTLANMFHVASSFNQPLNSWDVSSVTDMANLFRQASVFNQPLNSWNTSSVTDMQLTFFNTPSFNQDISAWDINQVSLFGNFMTALTLSTANYDLLLTAWDAQGAMSYSGTIPFGSSKYTGGGAVATARASLVTKWGAITDGGIA
jgi:surface protein